MIKSRWRTESSTFTLTRDEDTESVRNSNGLDQFFVSIQDRQNLSMLDFGGACQANVSFITNLGHRIYTEDVLRSVDDVFGSDPEMQSNPACVDQFIKQVLDFPDDHFDGVLIWDILQFLSPAAAQATVDRLRRILRPNAYVLAFFNANEKVPAVPEYQYRIADSKTLLLTQRGIRPPAQFFNNRNIERLFQRYHSIKFFLTRNSLREVIVRR